jgi:hypothetical protein
MGQRNLDRISARQWRSMKRIETVADMIREGWNVVSRCKRCGLEMQVQLGVIALVSGPQTSLWNRKARCRRLFCEGQVAFYGRPPGRQSHDELTAPSEP